MCNNSIYFVLFTIIIVLNSVAGIRILDQGILPLDKGSAGIFFFLTVDNESSENEYRLWSRKQRCCLRIHFNEEDCHSIDLYGGDFGELRPQEKRTLILVYPTVFLHDKSGSCIIELLSQSVDSADAKKTLVTIPFDTRVFGPDIAKQKSVILKKILEGEAPQRCLSQDDDSLNDCRPVKCDLKYGGKRPFFDVRNRRCVPAAKCILNLQKALGNVAYVPSGNICRDLEQAVTADDLNIISFGTTRTYPVTTQRDGDDIKRMCNCSSISQYAKYLVDFMFQNKGIQDHELCSKEATAALIAVNVLIFTACWQLSFCVCAMLLAIRLREMCLDGTMQKKTSAFMVHVNNFKTSIKKNNPENNIINNDTEDYIRQSVSDLCERMDREVNGSKRYRPQDVGSQVSLAEGKEEVGD